MALDQTQNFVEVDIVGTYTSTDTTISLESGGASEVPDPVNGEYNLVWFDALNNAKPSFDPEVEIVRVTGRDTGNDTLTVQRGRENTSAVSHDASDADYKFLLTPTSKLISDIDSANFSTNSLTVANTTIGLGGSGTPEADNLGGNNGSSGQVLQTDGSNASWTDLESETVKSISSDYTTAGETTILLNKIRISQFNSFLDVSATDTSGNSAAVSGIYIGDSGNKLYRMEGAGFGAEDVDQYNLSTAYDISTATYNQSFVTDTSFTKDIHFNDNGTKMYVVAGFDNRIDSYSLSTAWDVSTATSLNSYNLTDSGAPEAIVFSNDGTKMFVVDGGNDQVDEYSLSSAYEITSTSYSGNSISTQDFSPVGITFNSNGSLLYEINVYNNNCVVYEYELSTAFDLSSASYTGFSKQVEPEGNTDQQGIQLVESQNLVLTGSNSGNKIYSHDYESLPQVTLSSPDASSGKIVRVKDATGSVGSNSVTIDTEGSEMIDGSSSISLNTDYGVKQLQSDGTNWHIISDG
jgi:hypothetical protein